MLYGTASYEGRVRTCDNCGTITNVFSTCSDCDETICEACDHTCAVTDPNVWVDKEKELAELADERRAA